MLSRLNLTREQLRTVERSVRYEHENEVLFPGVPELLETLSRQFKLGVIANQSEGTEKRLARWRIRDPFSLVFAFRRVWPFEARSGDIPEGHLPGRVRTRAHIDGWRPAR